MAEKQDITISGWIKRIGELRDGFLVGVGLIYIVGYIVWAYNAWRNNIGLTPAIDFQYFVAGIVPTLYLLGLYFALRISFKLKERVPFYLSPGVKGWRWILRNVIFITFGSSILGFYTLIFFKNTAEPVNVIDALIFVTLLLSSFFLPPLQNHPQSMQNVQKSFEITKNISENKRKYLYIPDSKISRFSLLLVILIFIVFFILIYFTKNFWWIWTSLVIILFSISFYNRWLTLFSNSKFPRFLSTLLYAIGIILGLIVVYYFTEYILFTFLILIFIYIRYSIIPFFRLFFTFVAYVYIILFSILGIFILINNVYPSIPQEFGGPQPRCAQLDVITAQLSNETRKAILPNNMTGLDSQVMRSSKVDVFFIGSDFLIVKPFIEKRGNVSEAFEIRRSNIESIIWCRS